MSPGLQDHDVDAAMQRARTALADRLNIQSVPIDQLRVLTEAILAGVPSPRDVQGLIDQHVEEARDGERATHELAMQRLQDERQNDLVDVDDRVKEATADAYERGKRRMRAKHAQLSEVVSDLREVRGFVESSVAWSGRADRRQAVLDRLDAAITRYTP